MLFLVEPLTRSEQNTRRDHPITAPSHPATKAIATTEHNVLTHPLKTPHNYPPLTPPLSKGCRYGSIRRCDSAISRPCCRRRSPHCATRRRARPWPPYDHPRKSSRKQAPAPPPPSRHRQSRLNRHRLLRLHPRPALSASTVSVTVLASTVSIPATASIFFTRNAPALFIHLRDDVQQALCAITLRQWALTS